MPTNNQGYQIIASTPTTYDITSIVIGHNPKAPDQYVTWNYSPYYGFSAGHYYTSLEDAIKNMAERALMIKLKEEDDEEY